MVQNARRNATWSGDQTLLYDYVLSDRKLYRHSTSRYVKLSVYAVHYFYAQGVNNLETESETKQTYHRYTNSFHLGARL